MAYPFGDTYRLTIWFMKLQTKIQVDASMSNDKAVVERIVEENVSTKLDKYLRKFEGLDKEGLIEFKVEKNKKDLFNATLNVSIDGNSFRYAREDYKNLDDLINHLFDHLKESLSEK